MTGYNLLIFPSVDGQEYCTAVLYPDIWSLDMARKNAVAAIAEGKRRGGEEWNWEDIREALVGRGFIVPRQERGPYWDE